MHQATPVWAVGCETKSIDWLRAARGIEFLRKAWPRGSHIKIDTERTNWWANMCHTNWVKLIRLHATARFSEHMVPMFSTEFGRAAIDEKKKWLIVKLMFSTWQMMIKMALIRCRLLTHRAHAGRGSIFFSHSNVICVQTTSELINSSIYLFDKMSMYRKNLFVYRLEKWPNGIGRHRTRTAWQLVNYPVTPFYEYVEQS